jgi:hypothetical protein
MQQARLAAAKKRSTKGVSVGSWRPGDATNTQGVGDWSTFKDEIGEKHLRKEMEAYKMKMEASKRALEERMSWK